MKTFESRCRAFFRDLWPAEEKVLVFGRGQALHPALMLIGEAPGEKEVLAGEPFVGKAGKNLTAFLEAVGLKREEIWITNTVKIRPVRMSPAGRIVNRPPNGEEIGLFQPWLLREIGLVNPERIVTLGNVALKALAGPEAAIGQMHGEDRALTLQMPEGKKQDLRLFPLYHPASVIYNPALKAVYARDLETLAQCLK